MIAAGKKEIKKWFEKGVRGRHKYMLVVYDRMEGPDDADSPYYAGSVESAWDVIREIDYDGMRKVMEVYDLTAGMEAQLAEKRAWSIPDEPERDEAPELFPAAGLLNSGEARLEFMNRKNKEYLKGHFGETKSAIAYPIHVFRDEARDNVYDICVYILEQEDVTKATAAAVYRFTCDGEARAYDKLLAKSDKNDPDDILIPLREKYNVIIDDPYIAFDIYYANDKSGHGPEYTQFSTYSKYKFSQDYNYLGYCGGSSGSYEDR